MSTHLAGQQVLGKRGGRVGEQHEYVQIRRLTLISDCRSKKERERKGRKEEKMKTKATVLKAFKKVLQFFVFLLIVVFYFVNLKELIDVCTLLKNFWVEKQEERSRDKSVFKMT